MNQEVKKLWTDALESGEYKQGRYALKAADAFCCLGVLCDLHRKATNGPDWEDNGLISWEDKNSSYQQSTYLREPAHLPAAVREWAGIRYSVPSVEINAEHICLSTLNDNGTPFSLIAEHIKRQL